MKASDLISWCRGKVGGGYVYGTIGEICTQAVLDRCQRMYGAIMGSTYYSVRCAKWMGKWVCDCSGLLKAARKQLDGVWADVSAQGTYDQCQNARGAIKGMPAKPGVFVFMYGKSAGINRMVHVGLYIGKGEVIEARGADYGIIITKLKDRPWTHYGLSTHVVFDVLVEKQVSVPTVSSGDTGDASTPKVDDSASKTAAIHEAVAVAHQDGAVSSVDYWDAVVDGRVTASGANVAALMTKYHRLVVAERN